MECVGTGHPFNLRVLAKLGSQIIDMHVGKTDNAEAIAFRHGCTPDVDLGC
jgi:hypothetical protein